MQPLSWTALEYEHRERSGDWFWILGIVALGGAILALIFGNALFAVFIVIGAVTLGLYALRHPRSVAFEINAQGVVVDTVLYPYKTLESFGIHEHLHEPRLIIKSQKVVMPYLTLPLADVQPDAIRTALAGKLPEEDIPESLGEKVMEMLGF